MTFTQRILTIGICALVTLATRFLPFILFSSSKKETPAFIRYLGDALPSAIFALLVVYCLKDVNIASGSHGIPEAIALAVTCALHLWKRQTLISIAGGTVCYMLLVQLAFAA